MKCNAKRIDTEIQSPVSALLENSVRAFHKLNTSCDITSAGNDFKSFDFKS
jgi:hypothetical protein